MERSSYLMILKGKGEKGQRRDMVPFCVVCLEVTPRVPLVLPHLSLLSLWLLSPHPCVHVLLFCLSSFLSLTPVVGFWSSLENNICGCHNLLGFNSVPCSSCLTSVPSLMVVFLLKGVASTHISLMVRFWNMNKPNPENVHFSLHCEAYLNPEL